MKYEFYFYNCSKEFIKAINNNLFQEIVKAISILPKRQTQAEINQDLFWILISNGWSYDAVPSSLSSSPPKELDTSNISLTEIKKRNERALCMTSTTVDATWRSDFGKQYTYGLVQVEVQFGKVESMFKDFCGFRIAMYERRLALGIEIVMSEPYEYFSHRKKAMGGMAYFDIAKKTLPAIGIDCPIWLIGIKE